MKNYLECTIHTNTGIYAGEIGVSEEVDLNTEKTAYEVRMPLQVEEAIAGTITLQRQSMKIVVNTKGYDHGKMKPLDTVVIDGRFNSRAGDAMPVSGIVRLLFVATSDTATRFLSEVLWILDKGPRSAVERAVDRARAKLGEAMHKANVVANGGEAEVDIMGQKFGASGSVLEGLRRIAEKGIGVLPKGWSFETDEEAVKRKVDEAMKEVYQDACNPYVSNLRHLLRNALTAHETLKAKVTKDRAAKGIEVGGYTLPRVEPIGAKSHRRKRGDELIEGIEFSMPDGSTLFVAGIGMHEVVYAFMTQSYMKGDEQ